MSIYAGPSALAQEILSQPSYSETATFSRLKDAFIDPEKVSHLQIDDQELNIPRRLPQDFEKLQNLRVLRIANLPNFDFQDALQKLANLPNLETLILSANEINNIPAEIKALKQLKALDLSHNRLSRLPTDITHLASLESLDLSGNRLSNLPYNFDNLKNLRELILGKVLVEDYRADHGNKFAVLPYDVVRLPNLEYLGLAQNPDLNFAEVFEFLSDVPRLRHLDLSKNLLRNLPEEIGKLAQLESLIINYNQISEFPHAIGQLRQLQALSADGNRLKFIPPEIANLRQLKKLSLGGHPFFGFNELQTIPFEVGYLLELRSLNLMGNRLLSLPSLITQLGQLEELNISGYKGGGYRKQNQFTRLPSNLKDLKNLKVLDVSCSIIRQSEILRVRQELPQTEVIDYECS